MLNERRLRRDHLREPPGRDRDRVAAELVAHPADQTLDHPDVAVEQPRLHGADGRAADDPGRLAHVDARQPGGALEQRVGRNLHAGTDRAAEVFAHRGDRVERRRRPEVDDDQRPPGALAEFFVSRHGVDDAIRADFGRDLVEDRHPGIDTRFDGECSDAEIPLHHVADRSRQRRHDRSEDDPADPRALDPAVREEPIDEQTDLVGRTLAHGLQPPALDERRAIEDAEHDVGVADVNSEEHKTCQYNQETSPETMRSNRSPTRTSKAPSSPMPAVTPASAPAAVVQVTRAPDAAGAFRRQASRIASNRPASRSSYRRESATSVSTSRWFRSTGRPNSDSSDVARSRRSGGKAVDATLMP